MKSVPDLFLPSAVETFDSRLESGLARGNEHRDNPQTQTKADYTSDAVWMVVGSLKYVGIIKLCITG